MRSHDGESRPRTATCVTRPAASSLYCVFFRVHSLTHPATPAGAHVGDSHDVGGVLARSCSGADIIRQPGIPRRLGGRSEIATPSRPLLPRGLPTRIQRGRALPLTLRTAPHDNRTRSSEASSSVSLGYSGPKNNVKTTSNQPNNCEPYCSKRWA